MIFTAIHRSASILFYANCISKRFFCVLLKSYLIKYQIVFLFKRINNKLISTAIIPKIPK